MIPRSVLVQSLLNARRGTVVWSLVLAGFGALIALAFPTIRDMPGMQELMSQYPEGLRVMFGIGDATDFTSAAGFFNGELFAFIGPAMMIAYAITLGAGAIAGEEDRGTADLLLSMPISRLRIYVQKLAAMDVGLAIVGAVFWAALWASTASIDVAIGPDRLGAATLLLVLLAWVVGGFAFALGAAFGRHSLAVGMTAVLALAAYFVNSLGQLLPSVAPARIYSPFYYYQTATALHSGLDPRDAAVLLAISATLAIVGFLPFRRRDIAG